MTGAARRAGTTARVALRRAGPERETALLLAKAALATVLAWQFSVAVLERPTPFYAPLAALLVVDRTVAASMLAWSP